MASVSTIFAGIATAFHRVGTNENTDKQISRINPNLIDTRSADKAMRSVISRLDVSNISTSIRVQDVQNNQTQFREVTVDQVRAVMGDNRWQATRPRITKTMIPEQRERALEIRAKRQAKLDEKLADYTNRINETMREFGINTPAKQACFLATIAIESMGLKQMEELPSKYASSKMVYKGRGIIQLTHEDNYARASKDLKIGEAPKYDLLVREPKLAASPEYAFKTAGWFWSTREHKLGKPNNVIGELPQNDLQDFRQASSLVNSGRPNGRVNHWGDRLTYYKRALDSLKIEISKEMSDNINRGISTHTGKNHQLRPNERGY